MTGQRIAALGTAVVLLAACSGGGNKTSPMTTTTIAAESPSSRSSSSATSSTSSDELPVPSGFLVIPAPAGSDPNLFGQNVSVTTTSSGLPVVAFAIADAASGRSQILTATYDEKTRQFAPNVLVTPAKTAGTSQSVSIARDDASGTLVLAWDDSNQIVAAQSTDDGTTWHQTKVTDGSDSVHTGHSPSIAASMGKLVIAFLDADGIPAIATGDLTSATFVISAVPNPAAGPTPRAVAPAAAASPDGTLGVAYIVSPAAGGAAAAYLPVGASAPVIAFDSKGAVDDTASAGLAYGPSGPVIGATICRQPGQPDACTVTAASTDGGKTFGAAVNVPPDSGDGGGLLTRLAVDQRGRGAFAYVPDRGRGNAKCGEPKLATSADLTSWATCSPDRDGSLGLQSGQPALAVAPDTSVVLAFQQTSQTAKAPVGVLVVIYSPGGGATSPL